MDEQETTEQELVRLRALIASIHLNTKDYENVTLQQARFVLRVIHDLTGAPQDG